MSTTPPPYPAPPPYPPRPEHPSATMTLVLGVLGLVACQVLSPIAWSMGNRVVREIDESGGQLGGRETANVGRICGIVGTVLLAMGILGLLMFLLVFGVAFSTVTFST